MGNQGVGSANGDAVWAFSLKGQLNPLWPPPPPATVAGPTGPIADGENTVKIGDNNVESGAYPGQGWNRRYLQQCRRHSAHRDLI